MHLLKVFKNKIAYVTIHNLMLKLLKKEYFTNIIIKAEKYKWY